MYYFVIFNISFKHVLHIFTSPWTNVTVSVSNTVSSVTVNIPLIAIYALNNIDFTVNKNKRTTTQNAHFELSMDTVSALRPMSFTNITITLLDDSAPVNFISDIQEQSPTSPLYETDKTYGTQGNYNVTAVLVNPISTLVLYQYMEIWDKLNNVDLICASKNCSILITGTELKLEYTGVPRSGFEYSINMDDVNGTTYQNENSSILYELYSLSTFNHTYTIPGNYNVDWSVSNGGYSNAGSRWIVVQNDLIDFQVVKYSHTARHSVHLMSVHLLLHIAVYISHYHTSEDDCKFFPLFIQYFPSTLRKICLSLLTFYILPAYMLKYIHVYTICSDTCGYF